MIIDEEIKLKRLQTIKVGEWRASIKNRKRDYKILEAQADLTIGRLANNKKRYIFLFDNIKILLY